jgi:choline dehydrogenase
MQSVTFTEPLPETAQKYGYTWDMSAFGGTTPIYSSLPPFQWGDHFLVRKAWEEMGIRVANECAGGDKEGLCWMPISEHPTTARRSYSGLGHYAVVMPRSNYHILVKHQVTRVVYPNGISSGPPVVEIRALDNGTFSNITANSEVVISAGALQTPAILQRSGIGSISVLQSAKIPVVHDLPGVGANLQDHSGPGVSWNYSKPGNFSPMPSDMFDPAFAADAAAGFNTTPARGPYTLAMSNSGIYMSLPNMTVEYMTIVNSIRSMATNSSASLYLPADYSSDPTLIAGYIRQLAVQADFYANPKAPSTEIAWSTGTSVRAVLLHPLSRGTVRLNSTDHLAQPILDYRSGSNPIDFDIHMAHLKYLRRTLETPTMRQYGTIETGPGLATQSEVALVEYIKDSITLSFLHPCCTSAMLPKELGGVVGPDLKVHGLKGLRVVDISVLPFLVSSHTSTTAYALGEKVRLSRVVTKRKFSSVLTLIGCRYYHWKLEKSYLINDHVLRGRHIVWLGKVASTTPSHGLASFARL